MWDLIYFQLSLILCGSAGLKMYNGLQPAGPWAYAEGGGQGRAWPSPKSLDKKYVFHHKEK